MGFEAILKENESHDSLMSIVRNRYSLGSKTSVVLTFNILAKMLAPTGLLPVPVDIATDSDVAMFMGVRLGYPDLAMFVTVGAEAVASYQFYCRSPFVIGGKSFLPEDASTAVEEKRPDFLKCPRRNLHEEEMVILHRVQIEMRRAKTRYYASPSTSHHLACSERISSTEVVNLDETKKTLVNSVGQIDQR